MHIKTILPIENNIHLRKIEVVTKEYLEFINDNYTCKYLYVGRKKYIGDELQEFINDANASPPNCIFGLFVNNIHVGNLRLSLYNEYDKTIEIGWLIRQQNTGQKLPKQYTKSTISTMDLWLHMAQTQWFIRHQHFHSLCKT